MLVPLVFLSCLSSLLTPNHARMTLTLLKDTTCLDGTPAGYYFEEGEKPSLWVIYLEGGGFCDTQASCKTRSETSLGSSKFWAQEKTGSQGLNTKSNDNPYFYEGNHVYIPYANGDVHAGQANASSATWGFYFTGHTNFMTIIEDLIANHGLGSASQVLLTGDSAGGLGTFANLDWLADRLHQEKSGMTVKGAPVAGYFFPGNVTNEPGLWWAPPDDYPHYEAGTTGGIGHDDSQTLLWNAYMDPVCVAAQDSANWWWCQSASVMYKYMRTPVFILENQYDSQQITTEMLMPSVRDSKTKAYVEYYGAAMINSIQQVVQAIQSGSRQDGLFLASCYEHTGGISVASQGSSTKIDGQGSYKFVGPWFFNTNAERVVLDDCKSNDGLPCNPTCAGF